MANFAMKGPPTATQVSPGAGDHQPVAGLRPFALERFFARYEFNVKHLLCCSDSDPLKLAELLELADEDSRLQWSSLSLAYTQSQGLPELRSEIARVHYIRIQAANVLVAAPQEAIYLAMRALLSHTDTIICMVPGYQSLYEIAASIGATTKFWYPKTDQATGQLVYDVADLAALVQEAGSPRLVVVNAPHNPSGWLPSLTDWQEIVNICRTAKSYLFSDEMYRGLELDPARRLPAAADVYPEKGISLSGVSKTVGLPGLRLGWLATHEEAFLRKVATLKDYTTICTAAPSEVLALMALRAWDRLLERQLGIIKTNLEILEGFARRWEGVVEWKASVAGTMAFPRFKTAMSAGELCRELAEAHGVLLLPSSVYDAVPGGEGDEGGAHMEQRCRIGYGRRDLPEALERLEAAMQTMGIKPAAAL